MTRAIALILSCLAGAAWAGPVGAETIRVGGTGGPLEAMRLAGEAFQKTHPETNVAIVPGLGSRGGIKALQAGAVDVAVSVIPAPAAEPGLMSVELGRTPIIFATASSRPGAGVTMADLVEIYSGRKTAWPDGSRLRVILRPNGDSDTAFLRALSPAMSRAIDDGLQAAGRQDRGHRSGCGRRDRIYPGGLRREHAPAGARRGASADARALGRRRPWAGRAREWVLPVREDALSRDARPVSGRGAAVPGLPGLSRWPRAADRPRPASLARPIAALRSHR